MEDYISSLAIADGRQVQEGISRKVYHYIIQYS